MSTHGPSLAVNRAAIIAYYDKSRNKFCNTLQWHIVKVSIFYNFRLDRINIFVKLAYNLEYNFIRFFSFLSAV